MPKDPRKYVLKRLAKAQILLGEAEHIARLSLDEKLVKPAERIEAANILVRDAALFVVAAQVTEDVLGPSGGTADTPA